MRLKALTFAGLLAGAVCSGQRPEQQPGANTNQASSPSNAATEPGNVNESAGTGHDKNAAGGGHEDEVPAAVKAAFPEARSVHAEHKDLTAKQIASIEKDSGAKLEGADFHSFVAHDASEKQVGVATLTDVEGAGGPLRLLVLYTDEMKIKRVTPVEGGGDVASPAFLGQFEGLGHDDAFHVGEDLKYNGGNRAAAEAVARAVKRDVLAVQTLYGKKHGH